MKDNGKYNIGSMKKYKKARFLHRWIFSFLIHCHLKGRIFVFSIQFLIYFFYFFAWYYTFFGGFWSRALYWTKALVWVFFVCGLENDFSSYLNLEWMNFHVKVLGNFWVNNTWMGFELYNLMFDAPLTNLLPFSSIQ